MNHLCRILFVSMLLSPLTVKSQKEVVTLSDSVYIYYFDLFDDVSTFDWGTVPKNFNFNNYRICFKNNSNDTLIRGRVTTGDGRVTYHYAGNRQLINPGEYFVIKPAMNTSLQYRRGRFSKSVSMTAMGTDSTYRFSHRFLGHFSKDTILPQYVPNIRLDEPHNPPLTKEETDNYWEEMERIKRLRAYRTYKPRKASDLSKIHYDLKIYVSRHGWDTDSSTKIFYKRYDREVELEKVSVPGEKDHFIFPNQDSVKTAPIVIKLRGRKNGYHKTINTSNDKDIFLNIRSRAPYVVDLAEEQGKVKEEKKKGKQAKPPEPPPSPKKNPVKNYKMRNMWLFMLDGKAKITEHCTAEIFLINPFPGEKSGWNKLWLTEKENEYFFKHRVYVDEDVKKVRWRTSENEPWQYNEIFLKRQSPQSLLKKNDSVSYIYGFYGKTAVNWDRKSYRLRIEDDLIKTNYNLVSDSIKAVLKWYGIPYERAKTAKIVLKNEKDKMRVHRALNKHFKRAILMPKYDNDRWLCGSVRVHFSKDVSPQKIKQLLTHYSIRSVHISEKLIDDMWKVNIEFKEMMSTQYHALMDKIFHHRQVIKLQTDTCQLTKLD